MLSDVRESAFNPMLAPYYLKGKLEWENCYPFGSDFYRRHDVKCHFGSPVEELDTASKTVLTKDGRRHSYDKCLVATGANASIPPVPGLRESAFAFTLRNSQTTRLLQKTMGSGRKVVIMGASLVGMKIAEILTIEKSHTIVVDVADQVMPNGAHPITAKYIQQYFERYGIEFLLGCSLKGLSENNDGVCCFFPESFIRDADFICVCTGIQANLQFVDRKQVNTDRGILIDAHCQSNIPGLYAAGDCAQGINPMSGLREWQGTWANASYQGRTAGYNMAGRRARFEGFIPQHISPLFQWTYAQVGSVKVKGDGIRVEAIGNPFAKDRKFKLLVYDKERLAGANLLNCPEDIGEIKQTIALGKQWSKEAWPMGRR
jgi:NADPH-dependent 2,4-dienoyl-CoA reductase/sulfur reductase-like enzyme